MKFFVLLLLSLLIIKASTQDCSNYNNQNACQSGSQTNNPDSWASRQFQTPKPNTQFWKQSYESLAYFACFSDTVYSSTDRTEADITITCRQASSSTKLLYKFGDADYQESNKLHATASSHTSSVTVKVADASSPQTTYITLEPLDLVWNAAKIVQSPNFLNGQKGAIVEMFGWPYKDIQAECPALAKMGYMGVRVFPPQESVFTNQWVQNGELNPWWFYYQPVSYKLHSRHGSRDDLRSLIKTCREAGVRVYADAVVNHMSGNGNDVWQDHRNGGGGGYCAHWGAKDSTAHSPYFTQGFTYGTCTETNEHPGLEFPSVPYGPLDFHCERGLNSWTDPFQLNYGWLTGLCDLDTESQYVRNRIASYFTDLIGIGFSGFRWDAAKHIKPQSIAAILAKFKHKMGGAFNEDFITWLQVLLGGEKDLLMCSDNDYSYGANFTNLLQQAGLSSDEVNMVKIWSSDYPKQFPICGDWVVPAQRLAIQNDCHDDQNPGSSSRDMGDKGSVLVIQKDVQAHRNFEKQLFSRTDGNWVIKLVLSSYSFMNNGAMGPPDGLSDCDNCTGDHCADCSKSMKFSKAHDSDVCGYTCDVNGWQQGVYTRVHRDYEIIQAMRDWMQLEKVTDPVALGLPAQCGPSSQGSSEQIQ